jgi:hypothetical protein
MTLAISTDPNCLDWGTPFQAKQIIREMPSDADNR